MGNAAVFFIYLFVWGGAALLGPLGPAWLIIYYGFDILTALSQLPW